MANTPAPAPGPRRPYLVALLVALAYLVPALATLGDYGPTWDFVQGDYPYGERLITYLGSGDGRFLTNERTGPGPIVREPHPDFDFGRFPAHWVAPVGAMLSGLSCRVLWTGLGLVPAVAAHHVPIPLVSAALVFVVTAFAARRFGTLAAVVAGGSLFLSPTFFGHAASNLKDMTECCFYTGAVLTGYRALSGGGTRWWLAAGAVTGIALAQKPNALFLPVQLALFLALVWWWARRRGEVTRIALSVRDIGWASLGFVVAFYAVTPRFWTAPVSGPLELFRYMLASGSQERGVADVADSSAVSFLAPKVVWWTTPPITLALAFLGLFARNLRVEERALLILGVAVPVGRNLLPGMRNFSGNRHFIEFLPMMALLAGCGAALLTQALRRIAEPGTWRGSAAASAMALLALAPPGTQVVRTHPHQIVYFNSFEGGLGGAQEKGLPDATDYWAGSYWQGLAWLSEHAEPGAKVFVPVADFVARAAAPVRLRPDIHVLRRGEAPADPYPLYVMYITRCGRQAFTQALDRMQDPVFEIRVQGGSILRIHRIADEAGGGALFRTEVATRQARRLVFAYLCEHPKKWDATRDILWSGHSRDEKVARLRELYPPELGQAWEAIVDDGSGGTAADLTASVDATGFSDEF